MCPLNWLTNGWNIKLQHTHTWIRHSSQLLLLLLLVFKPDWTHLAPPWKLTSTPVTSAVQEMMEMKRRADSSSLNSSSVLTLILYTRRSNEPPSWLRERQMCVRVCHSFIVNDGWMKWWMVIKWLTWCRSVWPSRLWQPMRVEWSWQIHLFPEQTPVWNLQYCCAQSAYYTQQHKHNIHLVQTAHDSWFMIQYHSLTDVEKYIIYSFYS